jgi:RIO-like serine/threonine protein kinase
MGAEFDTMHEVLDYQGSNIVQEARDKLAAILASKPEVIAKAAMQIATKDPNVSDIAEELAMFLVHTELEGARRANATEAAKRFFHEDPGLAWLVVAFLCANKEVKAMREVAECIPAGAPIPASAAAAFVWLGIDSEEEIRKHVAPIEVAEDVPPRNGKPVASDAEDDKI